MDDNFPKDQPQSQPAQSPNDVPVADWQAKAEEYLNAWKRAAADFENYKKRRAKEDQALVLFTRMHVLERLLPSLEALENGLKHALAIEQNAAWKKGMEDTLSKFTRTLAELGIEKIKTVGERYDHELHEAVEMVEGGESGNIVQEVSPGYRINGQTVWPAKVKVAK